MRLSHFGNNGTNVKRGDKMFAPFVSYWNYVLANPTLGFILNAVAGLIFFLISQFLLFKDNQEENTSYNATGRQEIVRRGNRIFIENEVEAIEGYRKRARLTSKEVVGNLFLLLSFIAAFFSLVGLVLLLVEDFWQVLDTLLIVIIGIVVLAGVIWFIHWFIQQLRETDELKKPSILDIGCLTILIIQVVLGILAFALGVVGSVVYIWWGITFVVFLTFLFMRDRRAKE
jgi:hypothetical protein